MFRATRSVGALLRKSLKNIPTTGSLKGVKKFNTTMKIKPIKTIKTIKTIKSNHYTRHNKFKIKRKEKYISRDEIIIPKDFGLNTNSETKKLIKIFKDSFMDAFKNKLKEESINLGSELAELFFDTVKDITELINEKGVHKILIDYKEEKQIELNTYISNYLKEKYEEFKKEQNIEKYGKAPINKMLPYSTNEWKEYFTSTPSEKENYVLIQLTRKLHTLITKDPETYNELKSFLIVTLGKVMDIEWYFKQIDTYLEYYEKAVSMAGPAREKLDKYINKLATDSTLLHKIKMFDPKKTYINEKTLDEIYPLLSWINDHFYDLKEEYKQRKDKVIKTGDKIVKHMNQLTEHQGVLWGSPGKGPLTPIRENNDSINSIDSIKSIKSTKPKHPIMKTIHKMNPKIEPKIQTRTFFRNPTISNPKVNIQQFVK
jgi:hypothetical protein